MVNIRDTAIGIGVGAAGIHLYLQQELGGTIPIEVIEGIIIAAGSASVASMLDIIDLSDTTESILLGTPIGAIGWGLFIVSQVDLGSPESRVRG